MDAIRLLLLSVFVFGFGGLASLLLGRLRRIARITSGLTGAIGAATGLMAVARAMISTPVPLTLSNQFPFGNFVLQMDGLSTVMVGIISLISLAVSVYSISYAGHYSKHNLGIFGFFTNLFIALMLLVVTIANAFYFLLFWEMMTLSSYFLVTFESEKKETIQAGYLYMLIAHAGGVLIMLAFFIFFITTNSFNFAAFRQAELSPALRSLVFLLAFIGFGAKAGMVPLHVWMPPAYSAAPSDSAALMASVMKKTAIYGILRICVDLLGAPFLWWGILVLFFGALSAVLGALYALMEHDMKRVLAYSSVENMGIILMGIGTGMIGLAEHQLTMTLLGFLAALYHTLNHAFFKGLLFLGAGSVDYRLGTRDLNQMGGLGKLMPWTSFSFLIGALAVSAIPPLNGFVSEWFTYQSFLRASGSQDFIVRVALPLCALLLALTGTLAAMIAIKTYGSAFMGPERSEKARNAKESPGAMLTGMTLLVIGCILLGLGAPLIVPYLANVVTQLLRLPSVTMAQGLWVYPLNPYQAILSVPLIVLLLAGLLIVPLMLILIFNGGQAGSRVVSEPWACGYGYSNRMSITAGSFDQPMSVTFRGLYLLRVAIRSPMNAIAAWAKRVRESILRAEPVLESVIKQPTTRAVEYLGQHIQALQMGDIRMYCFYIILTLAILLLVIFR